MADVFDDDELPERRFGHKLVRLQWRHCSSKNITRTGAQSLGVGPGGGGEEFRVAEEVRTELSERFQGVCVVPTTPNPIPSLQEPS